MKKMSFLFVITLSICFSITAQVDGVTLQKVKPSSSLREYEISYFGDKPVVAHNIKPQYVDLYFMRHIFQQKFMTTDSLLTPNEIASRQSWYQEYSRRSSNGNGTAADQRKLIAYEFDQHYRQFLSFNLSPELVQKYVGWGSNDQFQNKKSYSDFLSSMTIENIKKDLQSFTISEDLLYMAYGAMGNYDFDKKTLQLHIQNMRYVQFPNFTVKNHTGSLQCKIEMSEEEAQELKEHKYFRALVPVKPVVLEGITMKKFLKEPLNGRYFITEVNGEKIELIGNRDAQVKIMTIDVSTCTTR